MNNTRQKIAQIGKSLLITALFILALFFGALVLSPFNAGNTDTALLHFLHSAFELLFGIFILFFCIKLVEKRSFVYYGFSVKGHTADFLKGCGLGLIVVLIGSLIIILFDTDVFEVSYDIKINYILISFISLFCAALLEEIFFRGYMLGSLRRVFSMRTSIIISSLLFTVCHLLNLDISLLSILNIFLAGIVLGILYFSTNNIWLATGFHWLWNFTQTVLGFDLSGQNYPSVFTLRFEDTIFFNGVFFGFEDSYICTILLVLMIAGFYIRDKKTSDNSHI